MIINASIAMDSEELFVGETVHAQEDFQYLPFYAKELDYKLEIIEPAIAEIDTNGNIKGLKEGTTQVQLIVGGKVQATREISVVKPSVVSFTMEVLNPILEVGDSTSLSVHIESDYSEVVPDIKYSSSDPSVAEVDENGNIQAYGVGVATITVDANGYTDMKEIEVKAKLNAIQLEVSDISLELGETYTLSPTLITEPAGEETWELSYLSSDTPVATIDETGEIQALGYGETEITITSISGVEQTVLVTVTPNKVSNLTAKYDEYYGSIQLEWNSDYETDGEITYEIEMNVDGQEPSIMETTDTSFESNYVSSNTTYTFNVVSIIHGVRSEQETVSVHTPSDQENDIDEMEEENTLDQEEELLNDQRREIINNLIGYWKRTDELGNETHDDRYLFIYEGGGPDFWRIDFETQHNSGKTEVAYIDQIMINENNIMFNKVHILFSTENSITLRYRKGGGYGGITYDNEGYVTEHFEKISKSEVEPLYLDRYSNIDLPD